jgi:triacylglycerol esterase/lipase EstA (alpha/beta hydrolase family)
MTQPYQPWSPIDIERQLSGLISDVTKAQQDLSEARQDEVRFEVAHRRAVVIAGHSVGCPIVKRGEATVAQREEWIFEQTMQAWQTWQFAKTRREIAQDAMRALQTKASLVQTMAGSVRQAYGVSGG